MENQLVKSYGFSFSLDGIDIAIIFGILLLVYLLLNYISHKNKADSKNKKRDVKYYRVQNRAQLMSEITIGLKIISNLKTLIYLDKLTDAYFNKCLKRLEQIVICYDSEHGISQVARIYKAKDNRERLKIELSLLELEFRKV